SYREKAGQSLEQFADAVLEIGEIENIPVVDLYHDEELTLENMVHFKRLKNPSTGAYQNYKYPEYIDIPFDPEHDDYPYPKEAIHLTYDGLHPSDKGYEIIASKLKGAARRLISQSSRSKGACTGISSKFWQSYLMESLPRPSSLPNYPYHSPGGFPTHSEGCICLKDLRQATYVWRTLRR